MVNAPCRCFAGHFRHRGKVEEELTEILYDLFSLEDNQQLPYRIEEHYAKIIDRVSYLRREKEFTGSVDLSKENFLIIRGVQAWQRASERYKADQFKNND